MNLQNLNITTATRWVLLTLAVVLITVWALTTANPVNAQSDALPKPGGVNVQTTQGSLEVSVTWTSVSGATSYRVRLREAGPGNSLTDVASPTNASATIEVGGFGDWVVRVEACNDNGCGRGSAVRFTVVDVQGSASGSSEPTSTPEPAPQGSASGSSVPAPTPEPAPQSSASGSTNTGSSGSEPLSLFVSFKDQKLVWTKGVAFRKVLFAAQGGTDPITYTLAGSLPAGVTFTASTRTISGTPTTATRMWTFLTYKATDSATPSNSVEVVMLYLVESNIQFSATIPDMEFTVGQDIGVVQLPTATGCDGCTYRVMPLRPQGLRRRGTTLVGTPTEATNGPVTVTYEAADSLGYDKSIQFRITVNPPVRISGGSVPSFRSGVAINPSYQLPAATGGTGTITYSIHRAGWSLPTGVTFDSATRSLSGTPGQPTTRRYWMWYQATDELGSTYRERVWLGVD